MRKIEGHKRKNEGHKRKFEEQKPDMSYFWKVAIKKTHKFVLLKTALNSASNNQAKGVPHKGPKIKPTLHNNWIDCPTQ